MRKLNGNVVIGVSDEPDIVLTQYALRDLRMNNPQIITRTLKELTAAVNPPPETNPAFCLVIIFVNDEAVIQQMAGLREKNREVFIVAVVEDPAFYGPIGAIENVRILQRRSIPTSFMFGNFIADAIRHPIGRLAPNKGEKAKSEKP
mgnify:CR=1 FL=1